VSIARALHPPAFGLGEGRALGEAERPAELRGAGTPAPPTLCRPLLLQPQPARLTWERWRWEAKPPRQECELAEVCESEQNGWLKWTKIKRAGDARVSALPKVQNAKVKPEPGE
jgi:hypothetical protein